MRTLTAKRADEKACQRWGTTVERVAAVPMPSGNPFPAYAGVVRPYGESDSCMCEVWTGMAFVIPLDLRMDVRPTMKGMYVFGHRFDEDGTMVILANDDWIVDLMEGELVNGPMAVAQVWMHETVTVPVRFIEMSTGGGRIVRGDAKPVGSTGFPEDGG